MPRLRKATRKKAVAASSKKRAVPRRAKKSISHHTALLQTLRRAAQARARREKRERERARPHELARHAHNPIIEPREDKFWEMKATFNPGAVYADRRVHLLYRAIGGDDVSVLGYAASEDGKTIADRSDHPVYVPVHKKPEPHVPAAMPSYCSGGGWNGGCEDPRLTLIDRTVYLMYTAFDGWGSIRIALTSIGLSDFLQKTWDWKKPTLISPPGEIHKNWVLFPEKIRGKFAVLHSMSPTIDIEYLDNLDFKDGAYIKSPEYHRANVPVHGSWERSIRGPGPTPIKTDEGWLVFYHGTTRDSGYNLGAMLLDTDDPTKIIARAARPVLQPTEWYEKEGLKGNIIYSCGAVVKDGELYVYYGGADSVVCVAMANLKKFLDELKRYGAPKLTPRGRREISYAAR